MAAAKKSFSIHLFTHLILEEIARPWRNDGYFDEEPLVTADQPSPKVR